MSRKVKDIPISPLFENVIPIEVNQPHKVSEVICVKCGKRWISVRQADIFLKNIVCPNCGAGYVIETGEEVKTLRLISFMVLGYSAVALYLALVYWGVWYLILFFEVLYEHNNRIRNWIDAGDMVWNRACSSIECKWEEIRCHFWEPFSEFWSLRSYSVFLILRRRASIRSSRRRRLRMWIRRMFCRHDFEFTGNAKIIKHKGFVVLKGKYVCRKCGKVMYRE